MTNDFGGRRSRFKMGAKFFLKGNNGRLKEAAVQERQPVFVSRDSARDRGALPVEIGRIEIVAPHGDHTILDRDRSQLGQYDLAAVLMVALSDKPRVVLALVFHDRGGTLANSGPKPSAIVRWTITASRSF